MFIHLHTHSAYSLAEGAIKVKDLVKRCAAFDMPAVAVTDTNNLFGAMEFALEASKNGIQPIIGAQLQIEAYGHVVLLCQNEAGYRNLCAMVSDAHLSGDGVVDANASVDTLCKFADGLICLSGGWGGALNNLYLENRSDEADAFLARIMDAYGDRLYIEIQRHEHVEENQVEEQLIETAYAKNIPLVASNDCYFLNRNMHEAHDALLCIAGGRYISEDDRRKVTPEHYFKTSAEMANIFRDLPEAVENTVKIAQRCGFLLEPINPLLPRFDTKEGRDETEELRAQAREGLEWRLKHFVEDGESSEVSKPYFDRLDFELGIIEQMGFPGYFLICSDFIKWAKDHNIPVGPGRGSGAGSVVAWSLKITDLDPLRFNLLFERFLNPERVSMPDFDVDFCQERRDEVIRYVQEKYGYDRVAQIITFGKLQARAVVRDVGRVLQMPYGLVDRIAKMIPNNPANPMTLEEALEQDADLRAERDKDETSQKLITIALQLEGLYRHASTHAAGLVIGDRPLTELVALYRDPRSDMPVTQFNMKYVESVGLVKFDFLGLKTMTVVQKSVDYLAERGEHIDYLQIPLDDPKTFELLASGQTVGVFQLESAGMRDALRRMRPDRFEDIIALVSLYRPGPMDNIPVYCDRKMGKEEPDYMHPLLQPYLEETYGIMIYQEQVMQAAQALAGYSLGGADLLRRAMGKKIKEEMDKQRQQFIDGAAEHHQVSQEKSEQIFEQINKFAGYGFNKSHAAAYALIAYWTAWLKANYPVEFMAASMTLDMGNTDKLAVFKQDLDKMGIPLLQPDVNYSKVRFSVEDAQVRYALAALKGVGEGAMDQVVAERDANGTYKTLDDFAARCDPKALNKRQMEQLAAAGAFTSLNDNRAQVYQAVEIILRHAHTLANEKASGQVSLFAGDGGQSQALPPLPQVKNWTPLELLEREFAAVGFYLSAHPLDTKIEQLEKLGIVTLLHVEETLQNQPGMGAKMAGVILKKQERVSQKGNKFAFLQLSDSTGVYEVMLFSEVLAAHRDLLEPGQTVLLNVLAESKEDQVRFMCQGVQKLDEILERRTEALYIKLDQAQPAAKLEEFLKTEGKGSTQIVLHVMIEKARYVEMVLPGKYSLSSAARNILRAEDGIIEIREV
jgi:DNA polymerase III subunit alpha